MSGADDAFDRLITEVGVPAAKQAWDDVVKTGDFERYDSREVMLRAGLLAIHGDGGYRRLAIEDFIHVLTVENHSVLVVRIGEDPDDDEISAWGQITHAIARRLREQGLEVTIVMASSTGTVAEIPERVMATNGWVRAGRLRREFDDGSWGERVDAARKAGDTDTVAATFWEFFNHLSAFADGQTILDTLDREEALERAARHYYGGVRNAVDMVAFLMGADEEDFKSWQKNAAKVFEGFSEGAERFRELVDPAPAPEQEDSDADPES